MHAVVNHMKLSGPIPSEVFERMQAELMPAGRKIPGFVDATCVRIGDDQIVFILLAENAEALERIHAQVGGPWIGANVRPYVASVDRKVGEVVARSG
jgi:hypothetical protein